MGGSARFPGISGSSAKFSGAGGGAAASGGEGGSEFKLIDLGTAVRARERLVGPCAGEWCITGDFSWSSREINIT